MFVFQELYYQPVISKVNKFKEPINDKDLRARAKSKNKTDSLAYHVPYRLREALSSIYLLLLQAGAKVTFVPFPGTGSPVSCPRCADVGDGDGAGARRVLVGEGQRIPLRLVEAVP